MWSDNETSIDLLGFAVHKDLIRHVITDKAVLATWYIRSKKDGLGLLDHSYPLTRNPIEGQGNRFFSLDGERSSFDGFWAYDDDPLGRIDSLMKGRLRSLLFKPPFDTHGADRLRSE